MSAETKKLLIAEINASDNISLLKDIYSLFNQETSSQELFMLSEEQIKSVIASKEQIKSGQYISNEQLNLEIEEGLKEK